MIAPTRQQALARRPDPGGTRMPPTVHSSHPDEGWCDPVASRSLRRMTGGTPSPATRSSVSRRLASEENGQILLMTGLLMVVLLIATALVIDIGHAQLVQRQLQAGVDAAALAGAQDLPVKADAEATAHEYSPTPGSKNAVNTVDNATTTVDVRCITTIPGCNRYGTSNAVTVSASAKVPTFFGRIVGVDSLTVRAKATACYPCSERPLDIMLILDRTGSMCNGNSGPCSKGTDLDAAKLGIKTFLSLMDPKLDRVGLAVLPPAIGPSVWGDCIKWTGSGKNKKCVAYKRNADTPNAPCSRASNSDDYDAYTPWWLAEGDKTYQNGDRAFYVVSSLGADNDYVIKDKDGNWDLNPNSSIVQTVNCIQAGGGTSYSMAIDEAQHELSTRGRPDVQDVIVFFTDGGANATPGKYADGYWAGGKNPPANNGWFYRPCGSGVQAATTAKASPDPDGDGPLTGTIIYTIGYGISDNPPANQRCGIPQSNGHQGSEPEPCQSWGCKPQDALRAMASLPEYFYQPKKPEDLQPVFYSVAGEVLLNAARLVDNELPNLQQ